MKTQTPFWQKYINGMLPCLKTFKEALSEQRKQPNDTTFERFVGDLPDVSIGAAPLRLETVNFMTNDAMLRYHTRADYQQTDERLLRFTAHFIEQARKRKIPLYVHSAFRTQAEQDALNDKGRSNTRWPRAAHCQGKAVDIVHGRYHWQMTKGEWAYLGKLGKEVAVKLNIPMEWGGDWNFYDPAHWQLSDWSDNIRPTVAQEPVTLTPRKMLQLYK